MAGAAVAAYGLSAGDALARRRAFTASAPAPLGVGPDYGSDLTFMLLRREDFLFIQVDAWNMELATVRTHDVGAGSGRMQVLKTKNKDAGVLVFTFPPQSVGEQAYKITSAELNAGDAGAGQMAGSGIPDVPGNAQGLVSGWSRLAFFTSYLTEIPYTLAGLLDWYQDQMGPSLAAAALFGSEGVQYLQAPTNQQTAIEMPWSVVLSPLDKYNQWSHPVSLSLAQGASRYELWRTRLTAPQAASSTPGNPLVPDGGGAVRAVWNMDTDISGTATLLSKTPPDPNNLGGLGVISTNTPTDRWNLVHATSDLSLKGRADITTRKLWLSARGGFADWHGTWDINPKQDSLTDWAQLSTVGRDQYVRVVEAGYLFPWGLPAVKTTISEREFQLRPAPDYRSEAALRQITFLTVLDPSATYYTAGSANPKNALPFSSIKTLTLRTPPVNTPAFASTDAMEIQNLDGTQFPFHFVGTDWAGRQISFSAAALFIQGTVLGGSAAAQNLAGIVDAYRKLGATDPRRFSDLGGQKVAFAPAAALGGTDHAVTSITWGSGIPASGTLPFLPSLCTQITPGTATNAQAVIRLAAAEQISGGGHLPGNATPSFAYHPSYVQNGFGGANKGEVYLTNAAVAGENSLSEPQAQMIYGNGSGGGLLTPNIAISAISRSVGPVAGTVENIVAGKFDPADYFAQLESAKFLGGLTLGDVLGVVNDFTGGLIPQDRRAHDDPQSTNPQIPQISYSLQQNPADPSNPADQQLVTTINWSPPFRDTSGDNPIFITGPSDNITGNFAANLTAVITSSVAHPTDASYQINGELDNFGLLLLTDDAALIEIDFAALTFSKATGSKAKVTPSGISVNFQGPLAFLNDLEQLFAAYCNFSGEDDGATGGASVSVTPAGVVAELSVAIPPIELGMFTLAGIGFDAILTVPLDGVSATTFEFDFANANDPFTISAGIFGGGGYFQIVLFTHDIKSITLSFDFGAMMAIDLYVASGQASIVAGFSFTELTSPTAPKKQITLIGFVKLGGSLTILGIFSVSLEFDLQLEYQSATGTLTGTASMEISVGIFCLHVSFSASATATFAGGGGASSTSQGGVGVGQSARRGHQITAGAGSGQPVATFADQMPLDPNGTTCTDWQTYALAFIPPAS